MREIPSYLIRCRADELAIEEGCWYDCEAVQSCCAFLEKHFKLKDSGEKLKLLDWHREWVIAPLIGIKRPDGTPRYKFSYITCAKKNAKTIIGSLLIANLIYNSKLYNVSCYSAANDRKQASLIFDNLAYAITENKHLHNVTRVVPSQKIIEYKGKRVDRRGSYASLSCDSPSKHGLIADCVIYDELNFAPKENKLYEVLRYAGKSRPHSQQVVISSAGWDKSCVGYSLYQRAKSILNSEDTDTSFYPLVFECPEGSDLDSPAVWRLANPALGVCQREEDFKRDWLAVRNTIADRLEFERYSFNRWTSTKSGWIDLARYDLCRSDFPQLEGASCFLGMDIAGSSDLLSISLCFVVEDHYYIKHHSFTTEKAQKVRNKSNNQMYDIFSAEGNLTIFPGDVIEFDKVREFIHAWASKYKIEVVVIEKASTYFEMAQQLQKVGYNVLGFPASANYYNAPTKQFELLINEKRIHFEKKDNLLRWALGNASLKIDESKHVKPAKSTTESEKIDPLIASILALSAGLQSHKLVQPALANPYENRGILIL